MDSFAVKLYVCMFAGKDFQNKETFGQFPLQVDGFRDIHESLEAATAQGEIETVSTDVTSKSVQEVSINRNLTFTDLTTFPLRILIGTI